MVVSRSRNETIAAGKAFGSALKPGDVVALCGTLGTGKTTFIAGACEALGIRAHVTSPSFTMINEYTAPWGTVVHIDLYRISSRDEIAELGVAEYFNEQTICLIEWAEYVLDLLPERRYLVRIEHGSLDGERRIVIQQPPGAIVENQERLGPLFNRLPGTHA